MGLSGGKWAVLYPFAEPEPKIRPRRRWTLCKTQNTTSKCEQPQQEFNEMFLLIWTEMERKGRSNIDTFFQICCCFPSKLVSRQMAASIFRARLGLGAELSGTGVWGAVGACVRASSACISPKYRHGSCWCDTGLGGHLRLSRVMAQMGRLVWGSCSPLGTRVWASGSCGLGPNWWWSLSSNVGVSGV